MFQAAAQHRRFRGGRGGEKEGEGGFEHRPGITYALSGPVARPLCKYVCPVDWKRNRHQIASEFFAGESPSIRMSQESLTNVGLVRPTVPAYVQCEGVRGASL